MSLNYAKLSPEDVRRWYEDMERTQILEGITFPTKKSSDGYYHVWVKDPEKGGRKQYKAKDLEQLKEKVCNRLTEWRKFSVIFAKSQKEKLTYIKDEEKRLSVLNTIKVNQGVFDRYILGTNFADLKVHQITKDDIEDLCLFNLQRYNMRKRAFMNFRCILRSTFKYAFEHYMITDNVYDRVNFNKFDHMLIKPVPIRKRVHSETDYERILDYIHEAQAAKPSYVVPYALELQMLMGLRRGEVPPLLWSDICGGVVQIYKEQITVRKSEYNPREYSTIVEHTKTYKDRVFPVTNDISDLLERLRSVSYESEFLFPSNRSPVGCIGNQAIYKFYRKACKDLGIELSRDEIKGTHSFRRNAITRTANRSGDMVLTSQLYGNSPTVAMGNYYTGINVSEAREMLEAM